MTTIRKAAGVLPQMMMMYVAIRHVFWGVLIVGWPSATGATPTSILISTLPGSRIEVAFILFVASVMAAWTMTRNGPDLVTLVLLFPQIFLVTVVAMGALDAIFQGEYADGTVRPWPFLLADQFHLILTFVLHEVAVIGVHRHLFNWSKWRL